MAIINHWSCSKLADLIRGTPKLGVATREEWAKWRETARAAHPFRYWLAEDCLQATQRTVRLPLTAYSNVVSYISNRWVYNSNALVARRENIKPGQYCDLSEAMLYCNFDALRDFVETECAMMHIICDGDRKVPWYTSFKVVRMPEDGVAHLKWASTLTYDQNAPPHLAGKPDRQAQNAMETLELYNWWTIVRPNRPNSYDKFFAAKKQLKANTVKGIEDPALTREFVSELYATAAATEAQYEQEDEDMLIRLMKIRKSLWT